MDREELRAVLRAVDEAEVVSFDVFDTLVTRDFYKPVDLFRYMEEAHGLEDFGNRRPAAETLAREKYDRFEDIDVAKIYEFLEGVDHGREREEERRCCVRNEAVAEIYRHALKAGKRIVAVSDMYLDPVTVEEILRDCGYEGIEKIYVSGEHNATKGSGSLYEKVLKDLGTPPKKVLHLGDNRHSDFEMAVKAGIRAIHLPAPRERLAACVNEALPRLLEKHATPQSSLLAGLLARDYPALCRENYWYRFGYAYAGPVLFGFMHFVRAYCRKHGIERVYFMARDGKIMQAVFDILDGGEGVESHYMYASRRMFYVASLRSLEGDELAQLVDSEAHVAFGDIVGRLGFDWLVEAAKERFGDLGREIVSASDRAELKDFFLGHRKAILDEARKERENLLAYLKSIGFFENEKRVVVDVGWGCSSQKYLERILGEKVRGLYFGTHDATYAHEWLEGYFFHKGEPKAHNDLVVQALPVVELLFMGDHYSVTKVDENLEPVFHRPNPFEERRLAIARDVHRGATEFSKAYGKLLEKYGLGVDHGIVRAVLKALLEEGGEEDIRHIAEVPHAASMGESAYEPIIKNLEQTQGEYLRNVVLGRISQNRCLWTAGQRRYQRLRNRRHSRSLEMLSRFFLRVRHCLTYTPSVCFKKAVRKLFG